MRRGLPFKNTQGLENRQAEFTLSQSVPRIDFQFHKLSFLLEKKNSDWIPRRSLTRKIRDNSFAPVSSERCFVQDSELD